MKAIPRFYLGFGVKMLFVGEVGDLDFGGVVRVGLLVGLSTNRLRHPIHFVGGFGWMEFERCGS